MIGAEMKVDPHSDYVPDISDHTLGGILADPHSDFDDDPNSDDTADVSDQPWTIRKMFLMRGFLEKYHHSPREGCLALVLVHCSMICGTNLLVLTDSEFTVCSKRMEPCLGTAACTVV